MLVNVAIKKNAYIAVLLQAVESIETVVLEKSWAESVCEDDCVIEVRLFQSVVEIDSVTLSLHGLTLKSVAEAVSPRGLKAGSRLFP